MNFLLVGHGGFSNRGCEAIVRTTAALLRQQFPGCEMVLSSFTPEADRRSPAAQGLRVIPAKFRRFSGAWMLRQVGKALRADWTWKCQLAPILRAVEQADAVLSVGGDNFTADYSRLPSYYLAANRLALESGKPVIVWGASIGPFPEADVRQVILSELAKADLITVRETLTRDYLAEHGVKENVRLVADPAFLLEPAPLAVDSFWPRRESVLGLNLSPILGRYRSDGGGQPLLDAAAALICCAVEANLGVLLIPHVTGEPDRDDRAVLQSLLSIVDRPDCVSLVPAGLSAAETKYIISRCRIFVGARTHSTIAALSSAVPTISIAYSQKALGINRDIFGHQRFVVDVRDLNERTLSAAFTELLSQENEVRAQLQKALPGIREQSQAGVRYLAEVVARKGGAPGG